jgi:hypothetical protein
VAINCPNYGKIKTGYTPKYSHEFLSIEMTLLIENFGGMGEKDLVPLNSLCIFMDKLKGYGIVTIHKLEQTW